jgi:hypothetical protein
MSTLLTRLRDSISDMGISLSKQLLHAFNRLTRVCMNDCKGIGSMQAFQI